MLRRICCSCQAALAAKPGDEDHPRDEVSHGLCTPCAEAVRRAANLPPLERASGLLPLGAAAGYPLRKMRRAKEA